MQEFDVLCSYFEGAQFDSYSGTLADLQASVLGSHRTVISARAFLEFFCELSREYIITIQFAQSIPSSLVTLTKIY